MYTLKNVKNRSHIVGVINSLSIPFVKAERGCGVTALTKIRTTVGPLADGPTIKPPLDDIFDYAIFFSGRFN
jgi:hypothetical protein